MEDRLLSAVLEVEPGTICAGQILSLSEPPSVPAYFLLIRSFSCHSGTLSQGKLV